jgi:hypothetical protein
MLFFGVLNHELGEAFAVSAPLVTKLKAEPQQMRSVMWKSVEQVELVVLRAVEFEGQTRTLGEGHLLQRDAFAQTRHGHVHRPNQTSFTYGTLCEFPGTGLTHDAVAAAEVPKRRVTLEAHEAAQAEIVQDVLHRPSYMLTLQRPSEL